MTPDTERVPSPKIIEAPGPPTFQHMSFRLDAIRRWRGAQAQRRELASL